MSVLPFDFYSELFSTISPKQKLENLQQRWLRVAQAQAASRQDLEGMLAPGLLAVSPIGILQEAPNHQSLRWDFHGPVA